ncbi:MAG: hypothetical protein AAFN17_14940 [Pseudomonadota bacterium]
MSTRRVNIGRLRLTLAPGADAKAVAQAVAKAVGRAAPTADRARLSVSVGTPTAAEAKGATARRVGRAVTATLRKGGGHDA